MKSAEPKEQIKKNIVNGAYKLFLQHGCKKVTMDQIAQEMHISKRTIYEQFDDKNALLDACMAAKFHDCQQHPVHPQLDEDTILMTLAMVKSNAELIRMHGHMMKDIKEYYPGIYDKYVSKNHSKMRERLAEMFRNEQTLGRMRNDLNVELAALTIMSIMNLEHMDLLSEMAPDLTPSTATSEVLYTYMRGLFTEEMLHRYEMRKEELAQKVEEIHRSIMAALE